MQESLEVMKTALRVLTALTEKRQPRPVDLDMLREYGGPQPDGISLDEYVCGIVRKAINRFAEARGKPR
jgi:hypothetical protein